MKKNISNDILTRFYKDYYLKAKLKKTHGEVVSTTTPLKHTVYGEKKHYNNINKQVEH